MSGIGEDTYYDMRLAIYFEELEKAEREWELLHGDDDDEEEEE